MRCRCWMAKTPMRKHRSQPGRRRIPLRPLLAPAAAAAAVTLSAPALTWADAPAPTDVLAQVDAPAPEPPPRELPPPRALPGVAELDLRVRDADIRPQVQIRSHENRTVEEYSVNGNVYMVKITPAAGAPYYLIDDDGSGDMSWSRGGPAMDTRVPQWALMTW